jgi:hypothetical protein
VGQASRLRRRPLFAISMSPLRLPAPPASSSRIRPQPPASPAPRPVPVSPPLRSRIHPAAPRSWRSRWRHGAAAPTGSKLSPPGSNQPEDLRATRGVANAPAATSGEPSTQAEGGQQSSRIITRTTKSRATKSRTTPTRGTVGAPAEDGACWQAHAFLGAAGTELKSRRVSLEAQLRHVP